MTGSNRKCKNTGNTEHGVTSRQACEDEAKANNARYYSYVDEHKSCFYSSTCAIVTCTLRAWNIYKRNEGNSLKRCEGQCEKILDNKTPT